MTFVENFVATFVEIRPFFDKGCDKGCDKDPRSEFLGQAFKAFGFEFGCLEFEASLEFGVWSLEFLFTPRSALRTPH